MKRLIAVLLSLSLAGCAAQVKTPAPAEAPPAETPSPVYTDWSKLTPYEPVREVFSRHAGYRTDGVFEPRSDYGVLLPYIGAHSVMEQYVIDALPIYGLVTDKGELVSDPVYSGVDFRDGFLLLYRGDPSVGTDGDKYSAGPFFLTLAAADGHWAHKPSDSYYVESISGLLMTAARDGSLDLWNADGESVAHFDRALFTPFFGEAFVWGEEGGPFVNFADSRTGYVVSYLVNEEYVDDGVRLYLDLVNGNVLTEPPDGYPAELDYASLAEESPEPPEVENCSYYDPVTDEVTGETYFYGYLHNDGEGTGGYVLFDRTGKLLLDNAGMMPFEGRAIVRAGLCSTLEDGFFCFRSLADNSLVFRYRMRVNSD